MPISSRLTLLIALAAISLPHATTASTISVALKWSAPGDDATVGRATRYDLRYSTVPISTGNYFSQRTVTGLPLPGPFGTLQSYTLSGLSRDSTYYIAIRSVDDAGNWSRLSNLKMLYAATVGVGPDSMALSFAEPWPNPASRQVHLSIRLPQATAVNVDVFDITGRRVCTLANGHHAAGSLPLVWNLRNQAGLPVATGTYIVLARVMGTSWTRRVTVLS